MADKSRKPMTPLSVTHFARNPEHGRYFSIERVFRDIRGALPDSIAAREFVCPYPGRGFLNRGLNAVMASKSQGDINHITGDVHYLALALRPCQTIITVHDCRRLFVLHGLRRFVYRTLWFHLPLRRCRLVSVVSQATKTDLLRICPHLNPDSVLVIPNPVSPSIHPPQKPPLNSIPRVLQIGTAANKNVIRTAEAVHANAAHLRIVGPVSAELATCLDAIRVRWSAVSGLSEEDLLREYHQCDVTCFASTFEGFGLPVVEAQAAGRPVITSNLSPMTDVAGDGALLVDPFDARDIAAAIRRVTTDHDLGNWLVCKGLENATRFDVRRIAWLYADAYSRIADGAFS